MCATLATVLMIAFDRFTVTSLTEEVTAAGERVAIQMSHGRLDFPLADHRDRNIQVVDSQGKVVASTPQLQGKPPMATFQPERTNVATSMVCGGVFMRSQCDIVVAHRAHRGDQSWTVYAASPTTPPWADPKLAVMIGGGAALLAIGITYLGNRTATASLRPVAAIQEELDAINAASPDGRVLVPSTDDEIQHLAQSVNHTLGQLHTALSRQRQMVADVSHDLRTPITALRAEIEDALVAPQETSVTKLGATLMGGLERLQAITQDLTTIARLDSGMAALNEPVCLSELVTGVLRARRPVQQVEYELEPGVAVNADRSQLTRLFTCLADNAERHAASTIKVTVRREPHALADDPRFADGIAVLEVLDDGPGIPRHKREMVFERFTRLDAARTRTAGGAGLGLPIARQIAESLGGTLHIEDSAAGARFVLYLPSAAPVGEPARPLPEDVG
ncbi:hypothetical protein Aph01nite_23190 [Acrocarpospora phusangensis]|uniref:histidine kinase n=1 Tax=Acrocarpospora phusangensis TaxID=1070424 RepID=A0A919QA59_9ACTN|nr:hypothetical protein Aph01nite_23190 [Acrocarpospora phusangensis]